MRKTVIFLFLLAGQLLSYAQRTVLLDHKWFTTTYATDLCSPIMGYYVQTKAHADAQQKIKRGGFRKDPLAPKSCDCSFDKEYSDYNKDYKDDLQQRFDQGHITPYDAFTFDETAAKETMLYANVCPQISHVNEQEWRQVEAEVLDRCKSYGDVKVWTGVAISRSHPRYMGKLRVPDFYWKVIEYQKDGKTVREAWLSSNRPSNKHTKAAEARNTAANVRKVIRQYYPEFDPGFN